MFQLGYSIYLNHFSEYKDYFVGSSTGMMFEWSVHNVGAFGFDTVARACDVVGSDSTSWVAYADRCRKVDLGPTIYHDSGDGMRGYMSAAMKAGYGIMYPFYAQLDRIAYLAS